MERGNNVPRNYWEWQTFLRNIQTLFHWHFISIVNKEIRWWNKYNDICYFTYLFIALILAAFPINLINIWQTKYFLCLIHTFLEIYHLLKLCNICQNQILSGFWSNICTFPVKVKIHVMPKERAAKYFCSVYKYINGIQTKLLLSNLFTSF